MTENVKSYRIETQNNNNDNNNKDKALSKPLFQRLQNSLRLGGDKALSKPPKKTQDKALSKP